MDNLDLIFLEAVDFARVQDVSSFFEHFEIIAQRPFSFESVDFIKKGYRRCVCGSDSIYFKINEDIIDIMAIVGRQDLDNIL